MSLKKLKVQFLQNLIQLSSIMTTRFLPEAATTEMKKTQVMMKLQSKEQGQEQKLDFLLRISKSWLFQTISWKMEWSSFGLRKSTSMILSSILKLKISFMLKMFVILRSTKKWKKVSHLFCLLLIHLFYFRGPDVCHNWCDSCFCSRWFYLFEKVSSKLAHV